MSKIRFFTRSINRKITDRNLFLDPIVLEIPFVAANFEKRPKSFPPVHILKILIDYCQTFIAVVRTVGCVIPMVVLFILPLSELERNDHQKDTPHLIEFIII